MNRVKDAYCSFCGTAFPPPLSYPRKCVNTSCGAYVWANPIPVSVVLAPVEHEGDTGLLVIRRGIGPRRGMLALVGGFVEEHETWQEAGAREAREESGVELDPARLEAFWFTSTEPPPNRVLLFSIAETLRSAELPAFQPGPEALERGLVFGPEGLSEVFAFPLHARAAERFFEARGAHGAHRYTKV